MLEASQFIQTIENRQGQKIASPEEIAWRKRWIGNSQLEELMKPMLKNSYGKYLQSLLREGKL